MSRNKLPGLSDLNKVKDVYNGQQKVKEKELTPDPPVEKDVTPIPEVVVVLQAPEEPPREEAPIEVSDYVPEVIEKPPVVVINRPVVVTPAREPKQEGGNVLTYSLIIGGVVLGLYLLK
jgi:hypothetical protein